MKLAWASDLHLDLAGSQAVRRFFRTLRETEYDALLVTGDLGNAKVITTYLEQIEKHCAPRPVYYVQGNHDYYFSSLRRVDEELRDFCDGRNVHLVASGDLIPLTKHSVLIGHRGWADGLTRNGHPSRLATEDYLRIADFRPRNSYQRAHLQGLLAGASKRYLAALLQRALARYRHIILATHVPPFPQTVRWKGNLCAEEYLPHYCNRPVGEMIQRVAFRFKNRTITVLAGHTHFSTHRCVASNLIAEVAGARVGNPRIYKVLNTEDSLPTNRLR